MLVEFRILGPLDVVEGSTSLGIGGPRQRLVLARLVVDAGRSVPTWVLIEDVWDGRPPRTAAKTLQKYVSELRRALGRVGRPSAPVLATAAGGGYVLGGDATIDARCFEQEVAEARQARLAGDTRGAVDVLGSALSRWRGDVLGDLPECRFADPVRTKLDAMRLAAVEERIDGQLELGLASQCAAELTELVEQHPLRERLWALLMAALAASGRSADALRTFQRLRRTLGEEVGLEPSAELRALEARILRQDVPATELRRPTVAWRSDEGAGPIPRFKVSAPTVPPCIGRPRLLDVALTRPVVVLAAPAGYGKTCLAAQVAAASGGRTAWFMADELDRDRATVVAQLITALTPGVTAAGADGGVPPDDAAAVHRLALTLESLTGEGCLVLDDVHLLPTDVVDGIVRAAAAALPARWRLVICTRGPLPEELVRLEAMGQVAAMGASDLAFDEFECGEAGGNGERHVVLAHTGGWPLAVALWSRTHRMGLDLAEAHHVRALAELALRVVDPEVRDLLVVLARLPRFPRRLMIRLNGPHLGLAAFVRTHPELMITDDEWCSLREWLRDALTGVPAAPSLIEEVATGLDDIRELDLAARLLLAEGRYRDAVPRVERLATQALRDGRAAWVRTLIASVPPSQRSFDLDLSVAAAAQALSIVDPAAPDAASEPVLCALVARAGEHGEHRLRAHALLASHYRMEGDARMLSVCESALGESLTANDPERALIGRWTAQESPAAGDLLRYYGHALLFAPDRASIERGQRLIAAGLRVLAAARVPTASQRAWAAYFEALLHLRPTTEALPPVRLAALGMAEQGHSDAAVRLAELATLEFFADERAAARRTIEHSRQHAARTSNPIALPALAAIEVGLDVFDEPFSPAHAGRFEAATACLDADSRLMHFTALIAAEFGVVLVRTGRPDAARRYLHHAEQALDHSFFAHTASLRCRRLRGQILLAEGSHDDGAKVLRAVSTQAAAEGRPALIELIAADLAAASRSVRLRWEPRLVGQGA